MRRHSYARGAALLAGGMLIAKILGALYRIPLTNILGGTGIGLYQLVFPVYALLITVTGGGIPVTLSRMIAESGQAGLSGRKTFRTAFTVFALTGAGAALILLLLASSLASIQGRPELKYCYMLIAPAVLLSTLIASFRGWFQGNMNMLPSAISQITEQVVKLALGLVFAYFLLPRGVIWAVSGAIFSITISETIALIILALQYFRHVGKIQHEDKIPITARGFRKCAQEILQVMVPITLGGIMLPFTQFIDSLLIVNLLKAYGLSAVLATAEYGLLTGPVGSLIGMPVVLTLAFALAAVPVVSGGRVRRDIDAVRDKSAMSVKLTLVIGVPASLAAYALAAPIINVLYPGLDAAERALAAGLLKVSSLTIILMAAMQIYSSLLQATDKAYSAFGNMAAGAAIKILLTVLLVNKMGIYGAAVSTIIAYSAVAVLNIAAFGRWTGKNEILVKNVSTIFLSGVIMAVTVMLITAFVHAGSLLVLILSAGAGVLVYGVMVSVFGIFSKEELTGMPMSRLLIGFNDLIRFWERK